MLPLRIGAGLMTSVGAEGHSTVRGFGDASLTRVFLNKDDDFTLKFLAGLLALLATVFFFGLCLGKRCAAYTPDAVSEGQDSVSLTKSVEAPPVSGVPILFGNDRPVVLETAGAVTTLTETMARFLAQTSLLLR